METAHQTVLSQHAKRLHSTSGTPPTRVDTTSSPAAAASTSAMQNASVSEVLRKTQPRASTAGTCGARLLSPAAWRTALSHFLSISRPASSCPRLIAAGIETVCRVHRQILCGLGAEAPLHPMLWRARGA